MSAREWLPEELERAVDLPLRTKPLEFDPKAEAERIAKSHGVTVDHMLGRSNKALVVEARRALYESLRRRGWSYPMIGQFVQRDHATVHNALNPKSRKASKGRT